MSITYSHYYAYANLVIQCKGNYVFIIISEKSIASGAVAGAGK